MLQGEFVSHSDLESLLESDAPMWAFDADESRICWANASGLTFWHASSTEELGRRDFSSDSENVKERLSIISRTLSEQDIYIDTWTLYPDNEPTHVKLQFRCIDLESGSTCFLIEVIEELPSLDDVEDRRMLEATRAMSSMITMMSLGGRVMMQNPAALKCYGPSQPAHSRVTDLQLRLESASDLAHVRAVVAQNRISRLDATVNTREGSRIHAITVQRGRDPVTGEPIILLSEDDISELSNLYHGQKQEAGRLKKTVAENADRLHRTKARIDRALEVAAIWEWDTTTDKLYFSSYFMQLLQYEPAEFIHKLRTERLESLLHPDDYANYRRAFATFQNEPHKPISHEMRFIRKSGDYLWIQVEGKFFCDEQGKPVRAAGLLTNITARKQMEGSMLASQKMEAIGQLTGGVAHDFNNLLTVVLGNAQLLERTAGADNKLIGEIVGAVERGSELTRHLLAFARRQRLSPESVNVEQLSRKLCATLFRILSETITIIYQGEDELWGAFADAAQLEAAMLNIALNARDAMPNGGTLQISTQNVTVKQVAVDAPGMLASGDYVRISISDTGTGMTPDTSCKAFEPFFSTKDVGQGTGLGLSMVLGFSQQSGGTTRLDSKPGEGTTVSLYLPKARSEQTPQLDRSEPDITPGHGEHVHILEDNEEVSRVVSKMVKSLGYRISTSSSVAEALSAADAHADIDVFVVDIILPGGKSGVDFAFEILKTSPKAKLILVSGYPESQLLRDETRSLDFVFLPKPYSRADIARVLSETLGKREVDLPIA